MNPTSQIATRRGFLKALGAYAAAAPVSLAKPGRVVQQARGVAARKLVRWQAHNVANIPHGYQVAVGDLNSDGKPDILSLSSQESIVQWYENPTWKARDITSKTKKNISLAPLRRAGYPSRGLALATDFALDDSLHGGNVWWAEPTHGPESEWSLRPIGHIPTSHRLRWSDVNGDGRPELVDAPIVGPGAKKPDYGVAAPLSWFELPESFARGQPLAEGRADVPWSSHLIDNTLTVVHGIQAIDWDGDGRDELLTASFEGVHLFHSEGKGNDLRWTKVHLAAGDQAARPLAPGGSSPTVRRGSSEIAVGNVGGRRFLATIEPWHGEQVAVYFEGERGKLWNRHVIDSSFHDGHALACADLNGDGNDEIVAGFRGQGTSLFLYYASDPSGATWERQTLDTEMAASGVVIDDINLDGRLDVIAVGASTGNVKWYENLGDR